MDFMEKEMEIAFDFGRRSNSQRHQAILNILKYLNFYMFSCEGRGDISSIMSRVSAAKEGHL
jgi:hypothetical protein